ncbi:GAF domain-containing protein [Planoprotostelium fungivorum]|uniref:GAF domain-containing protein n=1 Tax=Planoprotostelium fungivorum TaxID=1890364 RepID=A0A2P6P0T4_9EUKA|nr:GAF domain-containing protein [Planoprotostelium fungivorum]
MNPTTPPTTHSNEGFETWDEPPRPPDEHDRIEELMTFDFQKIEEDLQFIVEVTQKLINWDGVAISTIERDAQILQVKMIKSDSLWVGNIYPRKLLCAWTILGPSAILVEDADRDPRFQHHKIVTEKGMKSYIGVPLTTTEGHNIGTFCVWSDRPRKVDEHERLYMKCMAAIIVTLLEIQRRRLKIKPCYTQRMEPQEWTAASPPKVQPGLAEALVALIVRHLESIDGVEVDETCDNFASVAHFFEDKGVLNRVEFAQKLIEIGSRSSMALLWKIQKATVR